MTQLIDAQLLARVLGGAHPPQPGDSVYTTGYWYMRLCRAVLTSSGARGVLSTSFDSLPLVMRDQAMQALLELPDEIGLESLRTLAPVVGWLSRRHQLNALGIEVLAAAVYLEADVCLSSPSPRLQQALSAENRRVEIVR